MLLCYKSKTKSDVKLKGQRIQHFLQENINHAKTRQIRGKGEGHSKKTYIFFANANKNLALILATHRSFSF